MSHIKTAVSIDEHIFQEIAKLAKAMNISRSELLTQAAKHFMEKQKNLKILENLNEVYKTPLTKDEAKLQKKTLKKSSRVIDQW